MSDLIIRQLVQMEELCGDNDVVLLGGRTYPCKEILNNAINIICDYMLEDIRKEQKNE